MSEEAQQESNGFDLQVTHRDEKTGLVTHKNPYVLRVASAGDGGKSRTWERPVGSGNLWDKKGKPVGRRVWDDKNKKFKYDAAAEHVAFTPPDTEDQKLAKSIIGKDTRIATLEKELEQLRAESKKKQGS